MNNNQLPLVTHEQARRLKKLGFDWPVFNYYANENRPPTVALALKWMRDVKGFAMAIGDCHIAGNVFEVEYMFSITPHKGNRMNFNIPTHGTYEAAESALLDKLLKLIENEN